MGLLESLVVGGYLYTTAFGAFLYKLVTSNHLAHLSKRLKRLEDRVYGEGFGE